MGAVGLVAKGVGEVVFYAGPKRGGILNCERLKGGLQHGYGVGQGGAAIAHPVVIKDRGIFVALLARGEGVEAAEAISGGG